LKNIKIPEDVTYLGKYAFSECSNLISVEIPEGVTEILEHTFNECKN